jgi:hypothetical protein
VACRTDQIDRRFESVVQGLLEIVGKQLKRELQAPLLGIVLNFDHPHMKWMIGWFASPQKEWNNKKKKKDMTPNRHRLIFSSQI